MLGVLAIIAILMSIVAVGVLSAINRTRVVATMSNFKNLETAILGFVALPEASGKLPLTKVPAADFAKIKIASAFGNAATLSNVDAAKMKAIHLEIPFLSSGLLERNPTWRVGNDGISTGRITMSNEFSWNRNKGAFAEVDSAGNTVGTPSDWEEYVRTECAPVDDQITAVPADMTTNATGLMSASGVNFFLDGTTSLPAGTRVSYVVIPGLSLNDAVKLSEELNGTLNEATLTGPAAQQKKSQEFGRFVFSAPTGTEDSVTAYYYLSNI